MCRRLICLASFVMVLGLAGSVAQAQVAAADLLVDLRATDLEYGTGSTTWPNRGLLDDFTAQGSPVVEDVDGKKAVTFDASSWFDGPTSVPEIEGSGTRTIEVWAYNPSIVGEETMVSWAHRGGPGGTNMAFNYSDNASWGSVGHWGAAADMGYAGANSPAPAVGNWWHLVYAYDGTTARIYVNAVEETVKDVALNTHAGNIIRIGAQGDGSGANIQSGMNFIGSIAEVRIYSRALSQVEIEAAMQGMEAYPYALGPDPKNGTMLEATWITLRWRPGDSAVSHDVYLGDNFDDVNDGTGDTFQGNQLDTMFIAGFAGFAFPDGLVPGTTYYWRIDEVNDADPNSPWKGNIWSFWIPPKTAYEPVPANEAQFILADTTLVWTVGFGAKLHTVYFGDNFDDVNNASGGIAQAATTFTPGALELDKTYYWRVDELDPPFTHKGDIWSFTTVPDIAITDPALMGWWKLDEGMGATAVDWSGQGRHGSLEGDPQWVAGYDGGALELDGDDHVDTGYTEDLAEWTIACWVKSPAAPSGASPSGPLHREQNYQFNWNHGNEVFRGAAAMNVGGTWHAASYMPLSANTWYHLAATYDGNAFNAYRDGVLITSNPAPSGAANAESNSVKLGRHAAASQFFTGTVDDARVYSRALTVEEIQEVMKGDTSVARNPNPAPGSTPNISQATTLTWSPGDNAAQHDVYFGTEKAAVADADASDTTGIYRGRQAAATYAPADIEWGGGPYYWRIDEYNTDSTIGRGWLWSFSVADHLTVDDFESYNDVDPPDAASNRIFDKWIDGFGTTTNGALVGNDLPPYAEQTIVHGGAQSMPYFYDNNNKTSEATLTLVYPKDWTEEGVTKLSLWFRGASANSAERMFIALNGTVVVYHADDAATQTSTWTEWVIDLTEFAGVDLTNVNSITIGFGTKNSPVTGGTGTMYFDDIRLYR